MIYSVDSAILQLSPIRKDAKLLTIAVFLILTPPYCSHLISPLMFDAIIGFKWKVDPNFGEQLRLAYVKIP